VERALTDDAPSAARVRVLLWICLAFATLGVALALFGRGPLFAAWNDAGARALFREQVFPAGLRPAAAFGDAMLGGSIAGKWIAAAWLVHVPLRRREAWAHRALVSGLLGWFLVDSAVSLAAGAVFNVGMVNVITLVAFGVPLWLARPMATRERTATAALRSWRALEWACWISAAIGLFVAFAPEAPLLAPWWDALGDAFRGFDPLATIAWIHFVLGPIGATFFAHFVMLAFAARACAGERWVLHAVASSMLAWVAIDSALSFAAGAAFNVWWVNLPSTLLVGLPLAWAWRSGDFRARA
jgi:hypothetical protein